MLWRFSVALGSLVTVLTCLAATGLSAGAAASSCMAPVPVNLSDPAPVSVQAGACVLAHVTWAASSKADRDQFLDGQTSVMALDNHRLNSNWVTRQVDGPSGTVYFADAESVVFSLTSGMHSFGFSATFTSDVHTALNLYQNLPSGSLFVTGIRVVVGAGTATTSKATPCLAVLNSKGVSYGKAQSGCRSWGITRKGVPTGEPVALSVGSSLNPNLAGALGKVAPTATAQITGGGDGSVSVRRADGTVGRANPGTNLGPGDNIVTGTGGKAAIEFTGGGSIKVNEGTVAGFTGDRQAIVDNLPLFKLYPGSFRTEYVPPLLLIRLPRTTIEIRG